MTQRTNARTTDNPVGTTTISSPPSFIALRKCGAIAAGRARWRASLFVALAVGLASLAAHARPAAYSEFTVVTDASVLKSMVEGSSEANLYLPPGDYVLDNPVVISRSTPLFVHGSNRIRTQLVAEDPSQPLFVVQQGDVINFTNVALEPNHYADPKIVDSRALLAQNSAPVRIELVDVKVNASIVEMSGPGELVVQGTFTSPSGWVSAPYIVDHPQADMLIVGGNISNKKQPDQVGDPQHRVYHAWQKRGRLRIYGTGVQDTNGEADFRIESRSLLGPHVIADVRSEGTRSDRPLPSLMVRVPPTTDAVDILMKANGGAWANSPGGNTGFLDYNGAGTVWLVGNDSFGIASALVVGEAPDATAVAIGNLTASSTPVASTIGTVVDLHNQYQTDPGPGWGVAFTNESYFADHPSIPAIPDVPIPPPISPPRLDLLLPGMVSVTAFGAIPDDEDDDRQAIQDALFASSQVYFPPGTYHISDRVTYNHTSWLPEHEAHPTGGWIAGAGSDVTVIENVNGGPVFATEGMAYNTMQGLTLRTSPYDPATTPAGLVNCSIENGPVGHATQEIMFHDVVFDGGWSALGIAQHAPSGNNSENLMVDVEFRNADIGMAVGAFNAYANIVYDGVWASNHTNNVSTGGTWAVLGGSATGTLERDLALGGTTWSHIWYLEGYTSDAPVIFDSGSAYDRHPYPLLMERSTFGNGAGSVLLRSGTTGGPIFLRSQVLPCGDPDGDIDGDGVVNSQDNCLKAPNAPPGDCDSNQDGYGNFCDADMNGDHLHTGGDIAPFLELLVAQDPAADANCDGFVTGGDIGSFLTTLSATSVPGPSGPLCAADPSAGIDLQLFQNSNAQYGLNLYGDIPNWEANPVGSAVHRDQLVSD